MKVELLSTIGEGRTGLARLETINTHIENSGESLSRGVNIKPFVELIREYESKPNLAMPLIMSGIGMSLEGSEIALEQPETLREIVEATHLPISDELLKGTTELVTLGLDRLVVWLREGKQFSTQFGSEVFQELTISDYATRMASEQPEVRKLIRGYVKNHSGSKLPLSNMSAYIRGEEVQVLRSEKPHYPEPDAERITKIKELFFKLGIDSAWFMDLGRDYSISFKKEWMATRMAPNKQWNKTLFVELGRDFTEYSSWKLQKKVTPVMVDMDRLETDFEEVGANAGFATLGYQDNEFTLKVTRPDYKEKATGMSTLHNPGLYVGSTERMSMRQSEDFIQGYIHRLGRPTDQQVVQHFSLLDLNDKVEIFLKMPVSAQKILISLSASVYIDGVGKELLEQIKNPIPHRKKAADERKQPFDEASERAKLPWTPEEFELGMKALLDNGYIVTTHDGHRYELLPHIKHFIETDLQSVWKKQTENGNL